MGTHGFYGAPLSGEERSEMDVTHPTTAERLAAFAVTLKEVQRKRERRESVQPRLKDLQWPIVSREVRSDLFPAS